MVEEWLWTTSPTQSIVFDGFPRTLQQAEFLDHVFKDMKRELDAVIYLEVSDKTVIDRLAGRRICWLCRDEVHLVSAPFQSCPYHKFRFDPSVLLSAKIFSVGIETTEHTEDTDHRAFPTRVFRVVRGFFGSGYAGLRNVRASGTVIHFHVGRPRRRIPYLTRAGIWDLVCFIT